MPPEGAALIIEHLQLSPFLRIAQNSADIPGLRLKLHKGQNFKVKEAPHEGVST